nr:MAG TPA: hypothetical protein [Bacteriophage sp.]
MSITLSGSSVPLFRHRSNIFLYAYRLNAAEHKILC